MATQFGWKKKAKVASSVFGGSDAAQNETSDEENLEAEDVDWLTATKRKHDIFLEDGTMKSKRLKEEGNTLAEDRRFWEAIKYWNDALQLTPNDGTLHELKSQAFSELGELFPAVQSAEEAVKAKPTWFVARQRLGRAQMGLGEVEMALTNFQKAVHLRPDEQELWKEDLWWAFDVLKHKQSAGGEKPPRFPIQKEQLESESESEDADCYDGDSSEDESNENDVIS